MGHSDTKRMKKNRQKGQLTLFFGVTMMAILGLLAFIINVGLFVKAKINLQNAADAAAWSGAATQARQLTEIGYLNWEMRNTYKEWMFKYYVLGNLSIAEVKNPDQGNSVSSLAKPGDGNIQFYMLGGDGQNGLAKCLEPPRADGTGREGCPDRFNFPSVCIHIVDAGLPTQDVPDICKLYKIPGLPEIGVSTGVGVDETTQNFIDKLVQKKAESCTERSDLNFLVATNWAYGVKSDATNNIRESAPQVAMDRTGAFPEALETAIRIRTLEHIMNRAPIQGICQAGGEPAASCAQDVISLGAENLPHNERSVKAFYSAFRNLGNNFDSEMKNSLVITELGPKEYNPPGAENSLSYTFYPDDKREPKYYVDLRPMLLNLATFYTTFVVKGGRSGNVQNSAECSVTKVALPVPGYPLGFTKNPSILTYYAVKAEANFFGLLNPFETSNSGFVKLTAYAAAKPFGGRIGPHLFETFLGDDLTVRGRNEQPYRSNPYISGLFFAQNAFNFGEPIPLTNDFWVEEPTQKLGGWVDTEVRFGIPNLIYDYVGQMGIHQNEDGAIQVINPDGRTEPQMGLYNKEQFESFSSNFPEMRSGGSISAQAISDALNKVRAPTEYEKLNYLIPTPQSLHGPSGLSLDSVGYIPTSETQQKNDYTIYNYRIFAPLFEGNSAYLFNAMGDIEDMVNKYLEKRVEGSVKKYLNALFQVREKIISISNTERYQTAALGISNATAAPGESGFPDCSSIAARMASYLLGPQTVVTQTSCPTSFREILYQHWSERKSNQNSLNYFQGRYVLKNEGINPVELLNAYRPGTYQGGSPEGQVRNRILGATSDMRRNFYSTKFVTLRSVASNYDNTFNPAGGGNPENYSEGQRANRNVQAVFENALIDVNLENIYR